MSSIGAAIKDGLALIIAYMILWTWKTAVRVERFVRRKK